MEQLSFTQRWSEGRCYWRPAGEPFRRGDADFAAVDSDAGVKAFIRRHHYSGKYPAARRRFGMYRKDGKLVGAAVFSIPQNDAVFRCLGAPAEECLELGRLVLLDEVPSPAETWFVGECFRALKREGFAGVVSFSDPNRRERADGSILLPGHVGIVYQGLTATYLGTSKPDTYRLLPDGQVLCRRAMSKIRNLERGWEREVAELERLGAGRLHGDPRAWLEFWLPRITRRLDHRGNHKYAWGFWPAVQKHLPPPNPRDYPKPPGGRLAPKWGRRAEALALVA